MVRLLGWTAVGVVIGVLPLLAGCTLVAGLGPPKGFTDGDAGEIDVGDGGVPADGAEGDDPSADAGAVADAGSLQPLAIAVVGTHACAVVQGSRGDPANGTVRCWGSNADGELGVDPAQVHESSTPVAAGMTGVSQLVDIASLTLSSGYSCATSTDGYLQCWGAVPQERTSGVHREQALPEYAPSLVDVGSSRFVDVTGVALGPQGGAVTSQGVLACWGAALYEQRDGGSGGGGAGGGGADAGVALCTFSAAAVGRAHACAITAPTGQNDVECWGDNSRGQTGVPISEETFVPYPTYVGFSAMNNVGTIVAVAAGAYFSCALTSQGTVWCWGANDSGQLGNPAVTGDNNAPQEVSLAGNEGSDGGPGIVAMELAAGDDHACVVTGGHSVRCWGDNTQAQLGVAGAVSGFAAQPVQVHRTSTAALNDALHVAAGGNTTCVTRLLDSEVWCWGANDFGQTGQAPNVTAIEYATAMSL